MKRRLFMTATERVLRGDDDDVLSMDDERVYGSRFFLLTFKEAIAKRLICDYRILTVTVSDANIRDLVERNRLLNVGKKLSYAKAQSLAAGVTLKRAVREHDIRHAISFHHSIRAANDFAVQQNVLNTVRRLGPKVESFHISSQKPAGERADMLRRFEQHRRALITNTRCLTEGVDIPVVDCVLFADPKQSVIDIVQAVGRALRKHPTKQLGYVLLPLIVPDGMDIDAFAETTAFQQVTRTIAALSIQDERIAEEFRVIRQGEQSSGRRVEFTGDVPVGWKVSIEDFAQSISAMLWRRVARANWRPFEQAREFARGLGLSSGTKWRKWAMSNARPEDIPFKPERTYRERWRGMGDWLGTGTIAVIDREFRSFEEARTFARSLRLGSVQAWRAWAQSAARPTDIPFKPERNYRSHWQGWGDWLGTQNIAPRNRVFRPFVHARSFARSLGFRIQSEWINWAMSDARPQDMPSNPNQVYPEDWRGYGDWLGTGKVYKRSWRTFEQARTYVRSIGLRNSAEWRQWAKSDSRPPDIPATPGKVYRDEWRGYGDWLGTRSRRGGWRAFEQARRYVRSIRLRNVAEWQQWAKSGSRPPDIPVTPRIVYRDGWRGYDDWLGTGKARKGSWRTFEQARKYVRSIGLRNTAEWWQWVKSGSRPPDIPAIPGKVYRDEWRGYGDWLGTKTARAAR